MRSESIVTWGLPSRVRVLPVRQSHVMHPRTLERVDPLKLSIIKPTAFRRRPLSKWCIFPLPVDNLNAMISLALHELHAWTWGVGALCEWRMRSSRLGLPRDRVMDGTKFRIAYKILGALELKILAAKWVVDNRFASEIPVTIDYKLRGFIRGPRVTTKRTDCQWQIGNGSVKKKIFAQYLLSEIMNNSAGSKGRLKLTKGRQVHLKAAEPNRPTTYDPLDYYNRIIGQKFPFITL